MAPIERSKKDCVSQTAADDSILEQWLWTAHKILHPNHVWILEVEYRLLFLYSQKLKKMKNGKKPSQLRMIQLGLHLLEVSLTNLANSIDIMVKVWFDSLFKRLFTIL